MTKLEIVDFAEILQKFLKAENMSQGEFARRLGVGSGQVNRWILGQYKPGYDLLLKIFRAFPDVSRDFWFGLADA